ncbi:MAG: hypothetical protein KAH33_01245, partial [Candidatus Delongbacteria bacterium]|nr:hypothetical protein [Candidatus Delongbacteria bacterium]
ALGPNSQFINNTINNATFGFYNEGDADPTDFINNIVWGDIDGHVSSDRNILVAYNNDILGEMSGLLEEKNCFTLNPTYKSVKISDFYLDGKSKCVESGWFVEGFHEYGVNYYGDYPDRGALEFYIAISLSSPTNINISATSTIATVSWNSVTNANSYKIYRTTDPYGTYSLYTSTSNTYYNVPISGLSKYFYHIVASTDAKGELDNNESIELDKNTITIKKTKVKILRKEEELSNR